MIGFGHKDFAHVIQRFKAVFQFHKHPPAITAILSIAQKDPFVQEKRKSRVFRLFPFLFHCHALGKVAGLISIASAQNAHVIGEQLQRNDHQHGHENVFEFRKADNKIRDILRYLSLIHI